MRANHVLHDGTAQVRFAGTDVAHQQQRTASLVVPGNCSAKSRQRSQDAGHLHVVPSLVVLQRGIAKARSDAGSDQQSVQRALLLDLQGLLVLLTVDGGRAQGSEVAGRTAAGKSTAAELLHTDLGVATVLCALGVIVGALGTLRGADEVRNLGHVQAPLGTDRGYAWADW